MAVACLKEISIRSQIFFSKERMLLGRHDVSRQSI